METLPIDAAVLCHLAALKNQRREMQTALFIKYPLPLPIKDRWHEQMAKVITTRVLAGDINGVKIILKVLSREQVLPIIMLLDDKTAITVMNAMRTNLGIEEPKT